MVSSPTSHDPQPPSWVIEPREVRLDTIAAQSDAQAELIALARRHIKVFDVDLSWGGWNTAARCAALSSFMRHIPGARLDIIVRDTRWLERAGSRLTALLARYAHAMTIYRTGNAARAAMDPLMIVDETHFLHRYHIGQPGATLSIGDEERARPFVERFDEIWATGEPGLTGTVLGL